MGGIKWNNKFNYNSLIMVKKNDNGKPIGQVGSFTIRQIPKYTGNGRNRRVETSTIGIFAGKRKLKDGFKNFNEAAEFLSDKTYNKKRKELVAA